MPTIFKSRLNLKFEAVFSYKNRGNVSNCMVLFFKIPQNNLKTTNYENSNVYNFRSGCYPDL